MKKGIIGVGLCLGFLLGWVGLAWPAPPVKIGVIDLQRIIETSDKGKEYREQLLQIRKEKERLLAARQDELNQMQQDFQKKSFTLSERARLDKEQEIRQKGLEFKNLSEAYRQEMLLESRKLQTLMYRDLRDVITDLGKKEGFTIILDLEVLLYADDAIEITDKVITEYNARSKKR